MTLNYQGQETDLSGADSTYIFNEQSGEWIKLSEDLTTVAVKKVFDLNLPR